MWKIIKGNARHIPLTDGSVQCVVTSPPYWGLRDYGLNGNGIGLESTPEIYCEKIVEVFREVWRVLRDDGTVWVNLGDSYAGGANHTGRNDEGPITNRRGGSIRGGPKTVVEKAFPGLKPKDLVGIPWRVAFALQADGWYLRSDIIWAKPNPMPESVIDRPTKSHEYLFLLSKREKYYFDQDAVKEAPQRNVQVGWKDTDLKDYSCDPRLEKQGSHKDWRKYCPTGEVTSRNLRTVWNIATQPYPEAHFATFPEALVEPCIKAGTSKKGCCPECRSPWVRVVEKGELIPDAPGYKPRGNKRPDSFVAVGMTLKGSDGQPAPNHHYEAITTGWQSTCNHDHKPLPCIVLDPFSGSGTVGVVAIKLSRSFVGLDLKPDYNDMAYKRIHNSGSLFT